jgi:hypothetical protein
MEPTQCKNLQISSLSSLSQLMGCASRVDSADHPRHHDADKGRAHSLTRAESAVKLAVAPIRSFADTVTPRVASHSVRLIFHWWVTLKSLTIDSDSREERRCALRVMVFFVS